MTHHAVAQMHAFNREYPKAKDCYKKMRTWHMQSKEANKTVFFPMQMINLLDTQLMIDYQLTAKAPDSPKGLAVIRQIHALHLFGAWRNTLGIYQLDKDIIVDSAKSPIPDDTPTNIFKSLPEWCVYIDLSHAELDFEFNTPHGVQKLFGFWAVFDQIKFDETLFVLNIVLDFNFNNQGEKALYAPLNMPIGDDLTIAQALKKMQKALGDDDFESNQIAQSDKKTMQLCLSLLLWLCVAEPDIILHGEPISREQISQYTTKKKNKEFFIPPSEPRFYEVGSRLGGEVRHYKEKMQDFRSSLPSRKRPHIRRGHWHGYWQGTGQAREFKIRWQPAIFVNAG